MSSERTYEPTCRYRIVPMFGWEVYVHETLLTEQKEAGEQGMRLLECKLYEATRVFPERAVSRLRATTIWIEYANPRVIGACYHPSKRWLEEHDFNPDKAKGIEIGHVMNFLKWSLHQPAMILHELAHAYHHQVLGYDHPGIESAYESSVENGIYESVLRYDGKQAKAYALNNDQEYFAEQTEAFFGTNDFYPFVRAELVQHDPQMADLLKDVWENPPK